ncbi:nascent polypeptide-associated complex subunit alpha, partial [Coemansia mojavensis]
QSVAEKKARKALSKKGFEQVTGVTNLSVLRKKSPMFSIYSPDVYKNANSDTWIVFGEARVDNLGRMMNPGARSAARAAASATNPSDVLADAGASASAGASTADADADKEVDETGVASSDIELVIAQANCSRAKAVEALKNNSNDVVNAIMELTL